MNDAVERPDGVLRPRALRHHGRRLARSLPPTFTRSSSTPGTVRSSANGSREVGIFAELVARNRRRRAGLGRVEDWRRRAHGDRFGHVRHPDDQRRVDVLADGDE